MQCVQSIIFQVNESQIYLDIVDNDQRSTDASDGPVICKDEDVPENCIFHGAGLVRESEALSLDGLCILTQAWLENIIPVESLDMRLMRHVSAEAISGGRHAGTPVPSFCNPKV